MHFDQCLCGVLPVLPVQPRPTPQGGRGVSKLLLLILRPVWILEQYRAISSNLDQSRPECEIDRLVRFQIGVGFSDFSFFVTFASFCCEIPCLLGPFRPFPFLPIAVFDTRSSTVDDPIKRRECRTETTRPTRRLPGVHSLRRMRQFRFLLLLLLLLILINPDQPGPIRGSGWRGQPLHRVACNAVKAG